jgi:hypothetical protein
MSLSLCKFVSIALAFGATYSLQAHVVDIHPRTPSEWLFEEEADRDKESKEAMEILNDANSADSDKEDAKYTLFENGELG